MSVRHVVVAPNCFRGSLTQDEVANTIIEGLRGGGRRLHILRAAVADGGDGTLDICAGPMELEIRSQRTVNSAGDLIDVPYGVCRESGHVVIEAAKVLGFRALRGNVPDATRLSSYGLGLLLKNLIRTGHTSFLVGLGGSTVADAGAGCLLALGARFRNVRGRAMEPAALQDLRGVAAVDLSEVRTITRAVEIELACDTSADLGAALEMFGPQKGLSPTAIEESRHAIVRWVRAMRTASNCDMSAARFSGCNGGTAYALMSACGARPSYGADIVLDCIRFDRFLDRDGVVITAEGRLDLQTLTGKAPHRVALRAATRGVHTIAIAARVQRGAVRDLRRAFTEIVRLFPRDAGAIKPRRVTISALTKTAAAIAASL